MNTTTATAALISPDVLLPSNVKSGEEEELLLLELRSAEEVV
jgi:hypothetical protein